MQVVKGFSNFSPRRHGLFGLASYSNFLFQSWAKPMLFRGNLNSSYSLKEEMPACRIETRPAFEFKHEILEREWGDPLVSGLKRADSEKRRRNGKDFPHFPYYT